MNDFANNQQSRKWLMVINNPLDHGLDHDAIIERLQRFNPAYFCMADEISTTGTYHTHVYLYSPSPMRFSTVKNRFPTAHIEKPNGTAKENRTYVLKEGRWAETDKAETSVPGTFFEYGTLPAEEQERSPKMYQLLQYLEDGLSTTEIIRNNPAFAFKAKDIDLLRARLLSERYRTENRDIQVHYLYGETGAGKTRGIYERHPVEDVYRVTDYGSINGIRFDGYEAHPVLVFEEFRSQVPINEMLCLLDRYPCYLRARYENKVACYTTVYITSNLPLEQQYTNIQRYELETWRAFLRRIHTVEEYRKGGIVWDVSHNCGGEVSDETPHQSSSLMATF